MGPRAEGAGAEDGPEDGAKIGRRGFP
jgi:hypothetical protein